VDPSQRRKANQGEFRTHPNDWYPRATTSRGRRPQANANNKRRSGDPSSRHRTSRANPSTQDPH
jgi:hypothetical protein